ncbi:hypothetical protein R9X47_27145 [Wukongibacter baidiensis]|uniref:hypothetical protein n=1 Tax=Wukongibacter baidiensis TaxID=1723361 RepID=UPI003D7FE429
MSVEVMEMVKEHIEQEDKQHDQEGKIIEVPQEPVKEISLLDIINGSKNKQSEHLQIIQNHTLKLRTKTSVALALLGTVNKTLDSPLIAGFLEEYIYFRRYNEGANKDLIKALQSISYKELMDKTQVGVKIGGQ